MCIISIINLSLFVLFFRQWAEVSEGVYNQDVKEQLTGMCTDVQMFISDSVAKNVLQAIHQGQDYPSGTLSLTNSLSSAPLTEYFGITEHNVQRNLKSAFSQALCDIVGADTPGRISPTFTETITAEVIDKVNSVLSVAIQGSLDGGSSGITAAASCPVSKDRAAKKTLEGAISTMKSFLTGRGTVMKRKIQTDKSLDHDSKEETPMGGCKSKKSQWKRCFSGWRREKILPAQLEHLDEAKNTGESKHCSQDMPYTTSSSAAVGADLRSTQQELVDYMEDENMTPEDTRNAVSSLSSTTSISPDDHVTSYKFLENTIMADDMTDESTDSDDEDEDEDEETFSESSVAQSQPDSECLSSDQVDPEETKAKKSSRFFCFFHNMFSKVRMHVHGNSNQCDHFKSTQE